VTCNVAWFASAESWSVSLQASCRYAGSLETSYDSEELQPDWEIDPSTLEIGAKVGQGEFGAVHKVCGGCSALVPSLVLGRPHVMFQFPRNGAACLQYGQLHARHAKHNHQPASSHLQARWHGATVAVKILRQADEAGLGDFRTELNVLQKVGRQAAPAAPCSPGRLCWPRTIGEGRRSILWKTQSASFFVAVLEDGVLCTAGAPPACSALLRRLHQAAALHDRHRVSPRRQVGSTAAPQLA
jgi:hypothetical protein